jgi:GGDEF domain-containing protein
MALAPFRPRRPERAIDPENRALTILLDGIVRSALPSDAKEMQQFRDSMADLYEEVTPSTSPHRAALIAEDAVRVLEDHNRAERDYIFTYQGEREEMRGVANLLADCLKRTGFVGKETADIVRDVLRLAAVEIPEPVELGALRIKLGEHLARAVFVADHMRREASPDSLAATALYESWERREDMCVVLFGIERMAVINARFGYPVGDQMIAGLRQHLTDNLPEGDRLFRWRGPYLLALIERDMAAGLPSLEMALIGAWCSEYEIKIRDREALIPVSVGWQMFPLKKFAGVEDLVNELDSWTAVINSKGWSFKEKPG